MMIKVHEANSAWWGRPVGLVTEASFFALDAVTRASLLQPFEWVEYRDALSSAPPANVLQHAGFAWTDVQMNFRISLPNVPDSPSLARYECVTAAEEPFSVTAGDVKSFTHERFLQLPGATSEMLDARYVTWANELIARDPAWCLRLSLDGRTQGWFLAHATDTAVNLTLAMLATGAIASGQHLYQRCLRAYAARGGTVGQAAFSVRNTPVLNIYSSLFAKFTAPTGVWMWVSERRV